MVVAASVSTVDGQTGAVGDSGAYTDAPAAECFQQLFEAQVRRTPDRIALELAGQSLTYAALNARSNQVAHHLRRRGVAPGVCVALLLERSLDMIAALLGVLKAGGAYVPLFPESPRRRLSHQLGETDAPVVITQQKLLGSLPSYAGYVLCLDDGGVAALDPEPTEDPATRTRGSDLVYVIYTSGSTGLPKGVAVRHSNLLNYTQFVCDKLRLADFDSAGGLSFATVSTLAADLGNTCIFPALMSGGRLHVISHEMAMDGDLFAAYARRSPIDVLKITPSHLSALLASRDGKDLLPRRFLITGGEALPWELVDRVRRQATLHWINHYGPTETTIGSLIFDLDEESEEARRVAATVPIGRPIAHTEAHVVDEKCRPVALGEPGELYIAGRGVSAGYLKQPERTAERFLPNPFAADGTSRMYRTGDRVRMLDGGVIEFLGRVDHQIKLRGFRVELGEIESVLRTHPDVREAAVVARDAQADHQQVTGFIVFREPPGPPPSALHAWMGERLLEHMVPSAIVSLETLPLTSNGKVDRAALLALEETSSPGEPETIDASTARGDDLEERIAGIWRRVLGRRRIGVNDDFFQIGGHSLDAMHVRALVHKEIGKRLPTTVFFEGPTIAAMANFLRRADTSRAPRSLVPIQPRGTKPPIFCVHGGGGEVFWYRDLARRLGEDQPLYGLQARVEDDGTVKTNRVEEMATYYLAEIREAFPEGPYYLCGASFGGKVAYEMAQKLVRENQTVALLAMFDTWGTGFPARRPDIGVLRVLMDALYQRIGHHVGSVWMLPPGARLPYLRSKTRKAIVESRDEAIALYRRLVRWIYRFHSNPPPDTALQQAESFLRIASRAYVPQPYDGKVVLFRSARQPPGSIFDPTLGWSKVVTGEIEVHEIPGIHATMIAEPRVKFLVDAFTPVLARAQAEHERFVLDHGR